MGAPFMAGFHLAAPTPLTSAMKRERWLWAGCFGVLVHDLRVVLRLAAGRAEAPTAAVLDSRTLQLAPESSARSARC